jgi:hypothetical protein
MNRIGRMKFSFKTSAIAIVLAALGFMMIAIAPTAAQAWSSSSSTTKALPGRTSVNVTKMPVYFGQPSAPKVGNQPIPSSSGYIVDFAPANTRWWNPK